MSTILDRTKQTKLDFNPKNKLHVDTFLYWKKFGRWPGDGRCPFNLIFPYGSVPDMITQKLIETTFGARMAKLDVQEVRAIR